MSASKLMTLSQGDSQLMSILTKRNDTTAIPLLVDISKNPASRVIPSIWTMIVVSTVFLYLRVYCKKVRSRGVWVDDYVLIISWIFLLISNCLITELMRLGFGKAVIFVPHMHTISSVNIVTNKIALALSKTSFAVTMLRISSGGQKIFIWFLIVSMNAIAAASAVAAWKAACDRPADSYEAVLPGSCWRVQDSVIMAMVSDGYSSLVDFILALLPWPMIWTLSLKRHERIGVATAMSLGIIAGLVGVVKVVKIATIAEGADIPYRLSLLFIWGQAEPNVTIVASSIPGLRVLFSELYATSRPGEEGRYWKSSGQDTYPVEIAMNRLEEGRKVEEETSKNVLRAMGPSAPTNSYMRAREIEVRYDAMDEITQGTHRYALRRSEGHEENGLEKTLT